MQGIFWKVGINSLTIGNNQFFYQVNIQEKIDFFLNN